MADLFANAQEIVTQGSQIAYQATNLDLLGGGLTLGNFAFLGTEIPENVKFGLKEQMNLHKQIGGARIIDMIGDDPSDISWNGFFLGPDASDRAQELYALEQQKQLVVLNYGAYTANVVIAQIDFVYRKRYWVDFTITCTVVDQVMATGGGNPATLLDFGGITAGDNGIATNNAALTAATNPDEAASALVGGVNATAGAADTVGEAITFA